MFYILLILLYFHSLVIFIILTIVNTYTILTKILKNKKIKSIDEFKGKMDKERIIVEWQPQRKHITLEVKEEFASSQKRKFRV